MNKFFQILKPVTFLLLYLVFISWIQSPEFDSKYSTISNTGLENFSSLAFEAATETSSFLEDTEDFDKDDFTILIHSENLNSKHVEINFSENKNSKFLCNTFHVLYTDLPPPGFV